MTLLFLISFKVQTGCVHIKGGTFARCTCSPPLPAISLLIAPVPSAPLIDQKGSECSSTFVWLNFLGTAERSDFAAPPPTLLSHTSHLSAAPTPPAFSFVPLSLYIPLHFNTYTLCNIPDSISHSCKNDIYVPEKELHLICSKLQHKKYIWVLSAECRFLLHQESHWLKDLKFKK